MPLITEATMTITYDANESLSIDDKLYCSCMYDNDGYIVSNASSPIYFGIVTSLNLDLIPTVIGFHYSSIGNGTPLTMSCPAGKQFITFAKDSTVNKSSLKGHYNLVTFINDDNNHKAELFAVNSETTFSSK